MVVPRVISPSAFADGSFCFQHHRAQTNEMGGEMDGVKGEVTLYDTTLRDYAPPFELVDLMVVMVKRRRPGSTADGEDSLSEAMVKVHVGGELAPTVAEGNAW